MVDLARAQAALLALLPDNSSGMIEPQDVRDWLVSTPLMAVWAKNYDFPEISGSAVSPNLVAAALATLTFTPANPCPWGVNGADANHYLWISGGTGTAEYVRITGGTAVAGGSSGTLTFIPAFNHTGAWTVRSATAGIKEADIAAVATGLPKTVWVAAGVHTINGPIVMSAANSLRGETALSSHLDVTFGNAHAITVPQDGNNCEVANMTISASVPVSANNFLIYATGGALRTTLLRAHDLYLAASWGMIQFDAIPNGWFSRSLFSTYTIGFQVGGATGASAVLASDLYGSSGVTNCASIYHVNGNLDLANFNIQHSTALGSVDYIYYAAPGPGQGAGESTVSGGTLDGARGACIHITTAATGVCVGWTFSNLMMTGGATPDHIGILLAGTARTIQFNNVQMRGVGATSGAVLIGGGCQAIQFDHCWIGDFGVANTTAVYLGVGAVACPGCSFRNCTIGMNSDGVPAAFCDYAIDLEGVNHPDLKLNGNMLYGAVAVYRNVPATKTRWSVANNTPVAVTLASAATLAFGLYDDGQVISVSGATGVTAVSGLREGQFGTLISAATVTWTAGATIGNAFTPTANVPYKFAFTGGKVYVG